MKVVCFTADIAQPDESNFDEIEILARRIDASLFGDRKSEGLLNAAAREAAPASAGQGYRDR